MNSVSILKISGGEKWVSSISNSIKEYQEAEELCDVTLGCGDQVIQAHGLILSACSSFFKMVLLKRTPRPFYHPFIYLSGIDIEDLRGIVTFMYTGVVNVPTENILRFMEAARELKIEGLSASSEPVSPQTPTSDQEDIGATRKVEENCNDERESHGRRSRSNVMSSHSNSNRKRKINETDILVDDSNFEDFERSLLSKLWKDVDDQNKVVWKGSILSYEIINPF